MPYTLFYFLSVEYSFFSYLSLLSYFVSKLQATSEVINTTDNNVINYLAVVKEKTGTLHLVHPARHSMWPLTWGVTTWHAANSQAHFKLFCPFIFFTPPILLHRTLLCPQFCNLLHVYDLLCSYNVVFVMFLQKLAVFKVSCHN